MSEFLTEWHIMGLTVGLATFLIIGLFHPLVIKGYYYFGLRCRTWFAVAGAVFLAVCVLVEEQILSILAGVTSFSCFWSILEVTQQAERVRKGWFPKGPAQGVGKTQPKDSD